MKRVVLYCACIILLFASCGSRHSGEQKPTLASNFLSISDNEDKGIKEIIAIFGGECEYGFSSSFGTNNEDGKAFWIEVRKSETIDKAKIDPELIMSNIAYLFYRNLKEEKQKYTEIQVKVKQSNNEPFEHTYPVAILDVVTRRQEVVEQIFSYIKKRDFKSLSEHMNIDTTFSGASKEELLRNVQLAESRFGPVKELVPCGFRFGTREDGQQLLYFAAILIRENGKSAFSVLLDPKSDADEIQFIDYKF